VDLQNFLWLFENGKARKITAPPVWSTNEYDQAANADISPDGNSREKAGRRNVDL